MGNHYGNQDVLFLTEIGLYRLLGMSRKEKARKFQKWIATVVKEIRLNGKYELEKSLKETILLKTMKYTKDINGLTNLFFHIKSYFNFYFQK